jgi:hypothetical protein
MNQQASHTYRSYPFPQRLTSDLIASYPIALKRQQKVKSGHAQPLVQEILDHLLPYSSERTIVKPSGYSQVSTEMLASSLAGVHTRHSNLTDTLRTLLREIAYLTLLSDEVEYGLNLEWLTTNSKIIQFNLAATRLKYFGLSHSVRSTTHLRKKALHSHNSHTWKSRILTFRLPSEYQPHWKQILESTSKIDTLSIPPYVQQSIGSAQPLYQSYDSGEYNLSKDIAVASATSPIGWIDSWGTPPKPINDYVYCDRRLKFLTFCARIRESIFQELNRCLEGLLPGWGFPLIFDRLPTSRELYSAAQSIKACGTVSDSRIRSLLYLPAQAEPPSET